MFEVKSGIAPKLTSNIFKLSNSTYYSINKKEFVLNHVKKVYFSTESLSYLGPKLQDLSRQGLKTINVTKAVQFSSEKMGSTKLHLSNLQGIHLRFWLYIIQSYIIFIQFIYFSFVYFLNQLICNHCFICFFYLHFIQLT